MPNSYGPFPPKDPPSAPLKPPQHPILPPGGPTVLPGPEYPDANLPDWINSTQTNNPSGRDINQVAQRIVERTLTISPHGTYVPVVYGTDYVGPILSLIHVDSYYLYIRFVWCVGEIEEIEAIEFVDGSEINSAHVSWNHYTGTDAQGVDPFLSSAISGYADTMTDLGADDVNVAYSVGKFYLRALDSFPRVRAKIKGLKINSPVPVMESLTPGAGAGADSAEIENGLITATDDSGNGQVIPFIRYYVDDLIDGDDYRFKIEVEEYNDRGTGTAAVHWAESALLDDDSNPVVVDGVGTYYGQGSRGTYDATYNALKIIINGDAGVEMKYRVTVWNADGNTVYKHSDNAGLLLNHLMTDDILGLGLSAELESLADLIARNDEVLSVESYSEFRSHIGLVLKQKKELSQVIEVIRGYARTSIYNEGGLIRYMPHKPRAASFTITDSDIIPNSFAPKIKDFRNVPNVVRVYYTDTSTDPWRDAFVEVATDEALDGSEPRREARYNLPALQSRPAALRYGYEMLNERLRTFQVSFKTHQAVYQYHDGQTFTLDVDQLGSAHKMKMVSKKKTGATEYLVLAEKESDNIYSNEIADYDPENPVLTSPDPFDVLPITGLTLSIETAEFQTGIYFSRLRASWSLTLYDYNHSYKVELYENQTDILIDSKILVQGSSQAVFNNIQEGIEYRVEVTVIGFAGSESTTVDDTITSLGKENPPSDVPDFQVSQIAGTVTCTWAAASDNNQVWYYEIQYGPDGFEWSDSDSRILVNRADVYEFISNSVPPGEWDFLIKAVDNAGNESTNATRSSTVTVTLQNDLIEVDSGFLAVGSRPNMVDFLSDRVTNLLAFDVGFSSIKDYATKTGGTWAEMFPNGMNTYTSQPFLNEGAGVGSVTSLSTSAINAQDVIDGVFSVTSTISPSEILAFYQTSGGSMLTVLTPDNPPDVLIQTSTDGFVWTDHNSLNVNTTAQYIKLAIISPDNQSRWIWRHGSYPYAVHAKLKTQYHQATAASGDDSVTLDSSTRHLQHVSIDVVDAGNYYATYELDETMGTVSGVDVVIRDGDTGLQTSDDVEYNLIMRYT